MLSHDTLLAVSFVTVSFYFLAVVGYVVKNLGTTSLFSYHPLFMTLFLFLTVLGIHKTQNLHPLTPVASGGKGKTSAVANPAPGQSIHAKRVALTNAHGIYQGVSVLVALLGFAAIYFTKEHAGRPHFVSWHGFLGWLTTLYLVVQAIFGTLAYLAPRYIAGSAVQAKLLYRPHRASGYAALSAALAVHGLAIYNGYISHETGGGLLWYSLLGALGGIGASMSLNGHHW